MEEKTNLAIDLITKHARHIYEGTYEDTSELIEYADDERYPKNIADLAETFGLMSVKLEARELHLENTIDELRKKKSELELSIKMRDEFSLIFMLFTIFISIYSFVVAFLMKSGALLESIETINPIVNMAFSFCLIILSAILIKVSKLPITKFGITLQNCKKSIIESLIVSAVVITALVIYKLWAMNNTNLFSGKDLFNFSAINWTFFSYLIIAPVQEFIARGVFQGSIQRLLSGKYSYFWAIIMASLLFGVFHTFYSLPLAVIAVLSSILWGWLYSRHQTIIGISISHFILGNILMLMDFWPYLAS